MVLVGQVRRYLDRTGTPPTRFGRRAANDPRFVADLLNGREPRTAMVQRITAFIAANPDGVR